MNTRCILWCMLCRKLMGYRVETREVARKGFSRKWYFSLFAMGYKGPGHPEGLREENMYKIPDGTLGMLETWEEANWAGAQRARKGILCQRLQSMGDSRINSKWMPGHFPCCLQPSSMTLPHSGRTVHDLSIPKDFQVRSVLGFPSSSMQLPWATCSYGHWRWGIAAGDARLESPVAQLQNIYLSVSWLVLCGLPALFMLPKGWVKLEPVGLAKSLWKKTI